MSKTKVFIAGVLATTAAYVAYKALSKKTTVKCS